MYIRDTKERASKMSVQLVKPAITYLTFALLQSLQACHVLELQLWHCLPAFCSWATDLPEAYALYVKVGGG